MKNIYRIGLLVLSTLFVLISCVEDDQLADPSIEFLSGRIVGENEVLAFPGDVVTIEVELRSSVGVASLTANGSSISVDGEELEQTIEYDFTVPSETAVGTSVSVDFIAQDMEGTTYEFALSIITQEDPSTFSQLDMIDLGSGEGAAEIAAYDTATLQLFVVNNDDVDGNNRIDVVDFSDPTDISLTTSIDLTSFGGGANSVAVSLGRLAIAIQNNDPQTSGTILVYNTSALTSTPTQITVGALPDMVTFSPDGNWILVANEGEPNDEYTVDPEGSISVINAEVDEDGLPTATPFLAGTATFTAFNSDVATLEASGFRVFGPGATLAEDVEPEYITISDDSQTAYVTLQENNGVAVVDIASSTVTEILPLGFKDYTTSSNAIDPSNADGGIFFRTGVSFGLFGVYQPDAIASYSVDDQVYLITANEGDARDYDGFVGEARLGDVTLDETVFPEEEDFKEEASFGRLNMMLDLGDVDEDGDYDEIYSYGARSFSIWDTEGNQVFDSGNELDMMSEAFGIYDDGRSDDKGVEPEGVTVGVINDQYYAFIGLERADAVAVYDISVPSAPTFVNIITAGDAPEGLVFIPSSESPNGRSLLVVSSEDDGTVRVYQTN